MKQPFLYWILPAGPHSASSPRKKPRHLHFVKAALYRALREPLERRDADLDTAKRQPDMPHRLIWNKIPRFFRPSRRRQRSPAPLPRRSPGRMRRVKGKAARTAFQAVKGKHRRSGTGCVSRISGQLWEGRYSPKVNGKRAARNVYAHSEEACEEKPAKLIWR